jgi:DNA mismatch repair ATPase MutS
MPYESRLFEEVKATCRDIRKLDANCKRITSTNAKEQAEYQLIEIGRNLRNQLRTYLLFAYIAGAGGCKPEFFSPDDRKGFITGGCHLNHVTWDTSGRKSNMIMPVPNNASWESDERVTLITGSNSMGKSVYLRMIGLNILLAMSGFYPVAEEMKLSPVRRVWPCFDTGDARGTGHLESGQEYVAKMRDCATREDLLLIDEPGQGTEPAAQYALAKGVIKNLALLGGFNSFVVTHDLALVDEFRNMRGIRFMQVADYDDAERRYKVFDGISEGGYGMRMARKKKTDPESLKQAIRKRIRERSI